MSTDNNTNQLQLWLERWELSPSDGAKVLVYSKSKVSEILSEKVNKPIPPYIAAHIETFNMLSNNKAKALITKRLSR